MNFFRKIRAEGAQQGPSWWQMFLSKNCWTNLPRVLQNIGWPGSGFFSFASSLEFLWVTSCGSVLLCDIQLFASPMQQAYKCLDRHNKETRPIKILQSQSFFKKKPMVAMFCSRVRVSVELRWLSATILLLRLTLFKGNYLHNFGPKSPSPDLCSHFEFTTPKGQNLCTKTLLSNTENPSFSMYSIFV